MERDADTKICRQTVPQPFRSTSRRSFEAFSQVQCDATGLVDLLKYDRKAVSPGVHRDWGVSSRIKQTRRCSQEMFVKEWQLLFGQFFESYYVANENRSEVLLDVAIGAGSRVRMNGRFCCYLLDRALIA